MAYNPNVHHRRSIRLKGYDYSQEGLYFVTICVQNKQYLFGKIANREMILNTVGQMVKLCWLEIPQHFPNAVLHEYVIMPNHVHGIIELTNVGAKNFSPENKSTNDFSPENKSSNDDIRAKNFSPLQGTSRTIGSIIRGFKIGVTKQLGYSVWQRNFYEHIIRNESSYHNITNYIVHNPANWVEDKFYEPSQQ